MNKVISIIIPTYNRAKVLTRSVASVINQTADNWELIIVDDGSTDNSKSVLKEFLTDERVFYYYQNNSGVSAARNTGVQLSHGDYIIFLDSDDQFFPHLISTLNKFNYEKYDLIFWQVMRIINGKQHISKARKLGKIYNDLNGIFLAGSVCYKKNLFSAAGGYDTEMTFGENYELAIRISELKNKKSLIIDQIFLKYYIEPLKRSSNSYRNRMNSYLHQYEKHIEKYNRNRKAKAELNYLIGYVHEQLHGKSAALPNYETAWKNNPWRLKHFLKFFYLKFFR